VNDESFHIDLLTDPTAMARALPWLLVHLPADEQASHLQTFAAMLQSPATRANLLVLEARHEDKRHGVALAQLLPGRTALVWPPYVADNAGDAERTQQMFERLYRELEYRQILVAQALVDPQAKGAALAFETVGFQRAGELMYMVAELESLPFPSPVEELCFRPADARDPQLAEIIEASYRGSLDCPIVDGWRPIADVLAGYLGTGTFHPDLWQLAYSGEQIVGCLLMSEYPEHAQGEVMYLGLRPEYRGRGWGRMLARQALLSGHARGWRQVLLVVDEANFPARQLYSLEGFEDLLRRAVFVRRM
jgi:ribosomal protein S18 acetylase RimI-like enzyme